MTYARSFGQIQMGTVPATFLVKAILKRIENDILTTRGVEVEDVLGDHTSHDSAFFLKKSSSQLS